MPALLILIALIAAGQFEPLVYEQFEINVKTGYENKPEMVSRTCIYFSGYKLISRTLNGEYLFECPRRRGQLTVEKPGPLID